MSFLLLSLGYPALINLFCSVSNVRFETLRAPELSGLGNYLTVLTDAGHANWFSLRFGIITALAECGLGLFLAIFLTPQLVKRSPADGAVDAAVDGGAPAMVGLMFRLVLHEFAGPIPYYLYDLFR